MKLNLLRSLLLGAALLPLPAWDGTALLAGERRWRLDSFRAFSEGSFPDGGVNVYAAADGTVRLINAFDLNRDGLPDIFLPASDGHDETADLFIYWARPGYSAQQVTRLPTEGGHDAAVADLNRDGHPDLVVANSYDGTHMDLNAYIYWGAKEGFSPGRRSSLPVQGGEAVVAADLNGDGWPEIVIANNGRTYHVATDHRQQSFIYWNERGTFSPDRRTLLPTVNGRDVAVADLDGDGGPDLAFVNAGNRPEEAGVRIFWSGGNGYDAARSLFLPGEACTAVATGDLDNDGRPDLVLANQRRGEAVQIESFIYWNSARGFSPSRRTGLPTVAAGDAAIADLDRDGWPEVIFANGQGEASFVYWGSPGGFLPRRRLALPAGNARAVLAADLNEDGHVDVVFARFNRGENFDVDSLIYWGGPDGVDAARFQGLPTSGATAVLAADLQGRGRRDLVFVNKQAGTGAETPGSLYLSDRRDPRIFAPARRIEIAARGVDAYASVDLNLDGWPDLVIPGDEGLPVHWGGPDGFRREDRAPVFGQPIFAARAADFNRDGYLDFVLSEESATARIVYGGPAGLSPAATLVLPVSGVRFHTIADFNGDGWTDVAFPLPFRRKVVLFWNGPDGFSESRRTELPAESTVSLEAADLDADGHLDLIVPNLFDLGGDEPSLSESPEGEVIVYWGSKAGYGVERRTKLPAIGAADVAVADLDRDGRLDLAVTSYYAGSRRDLPSYIYWQGKEGFDRDRVTRLETQSASGVMAADFNADGWLDLCFANHTKGGDHSNDSFLYWGGPEGFSAERRLALPAKGPHFMAMVDLGNVRDRRASYDYLSPEKEFPGARELRAITWVADTPPGTAVRFQIRSAESREAVAKAEWQGAEGAESEFIGPASGLRLPLKGSWVQFRAIFSSPGGGLPVLRSATLDLEY